MLQHSSQPETALNRIKLIRRSLRCFGLGIAGLIPVLGLPFAVAALVTFIKSARVETDWNPARRYLSMGLFFSIIGMVVSMALGWFILLFVAEDAGWIG